MFVFLKQAGNGQRSWWADFTAEGYKRRPLGLAEVTPKAKAVTAMAHLFRELTASRGQMELGLDAPASFAAALDEWQRQHEARTEAGGAWVAQYAKLVRRELGDVPLQELVGKAGTLRLRAYRDELASRGFAAKTRRNRLWVARQVLLCAVADGHLDGLPVFPNARRPNEETKGPVYDYLDEASVRAVIAQLYSGAENGLWRALCPGQEAAEALPKVRAWIAARRLWVSVAFYTGQRSGDVSRVTPSDLSMDFRRYRRRSTKNRTSDAWRDGPEQLFLDAAAARDVIGPLWTAGAPVTGGPWDKSGQALRSAGKAVGLLSAPIGRVLRRSFARQLALRGWPLDKVRDYMGHAADSKMLEQVYLDCPERPARCFGRVPEGGIPWTVDSTRLLERERPHEGARVVQFPGSEAARKSLF